MTSNYRPLPSFPSAHSGLSHNSSGGFSLVELLIALLLTTILMAGLATVFQGSVNTTVNTSDGISSARRNRLAMDMIVDDLNHAGMLLRGDNLIELPYGQTMDATPAFQILPNQVYEGTDVPTTQGLNLISNRADQLILSYDQPMPFEGKMLGELKSAADFVDQGTSIATNASFSISLFDSRQAEQLASAHDAGDPIYLAFRNSLGNVYKALTVTASGNNVQITTGVPGDPAKTSFGQGDKGYAGPTKQVAIPVNTPVMFLKPKRYIRYSIQSRNLNPDPEYAGIGTPCLVREEVAGDLVQGSPNPFAVPLESVIVAENVIGFNVMLSVDGGTTWINNNNVDDPGRTNLTAWSAIVSAINASPAVTNRPAAAWQNVNRDYWFREIPVLVRVDVTTRTAMGRAENLASGVNPASIVASTNPSIPPYRRMTQSIILIPRHFGLPYQSRGI